MKKKIEALLQDSRLAGNAALERLQKTWQTTKAGIEKAKTEKSKAKTAYRNAANGEGKKNRDTVMALRTAFRQAKAMQRYHRAAFELAEYRIIHWLENWRSETPEPHATSSAKQKKALKKTAPKSGGQAIETPTLEIRKRMPKAGSKKAVQA